MIRRLTIQNLILIEKAEIEFGSGLNIITGETGSGKSALLSAIRLLLGGKADAQLIRNNAPLAIVEAQLIPASPLDWLRDEGIEVPANETISIRREIHRSGKTRCFFEDQQINLATLKKIVGTTIELVDQSSSQTLSSNEEQRKWLDAFGSLTHEVAFFAQSFEKERTLRIQFEQLLSDQEKAEKEQQSAEEDLTAIDEVHWKEGEEESLTQEHNLLTNAQELLETVSSTVLLLSESQQPLVPLLKRTASSIESMLRYDARLSEPLEALKRAALELEDASFGLRSYTDRLDVDPNRLEIVEERLAAIEKLKKRFGPLEVIQKLRQTLSDRIDHLAHLDTTIASAQSELNALSEQNKAKASSISRLRQETAPLFAKIIDSELISLNLPQARFEISIAPKEISAHGADSVSFLFSANPGYNPLPLDQCASGGELSRLLLAIKTTLANKEKSTCLIFDEIDSNVGGQTAAILGSKLQTLSQTRQVICVTHFVQVARCAAHHFLVSKKEATTSIVKLEFNLRESEFERMMGNK